MTPNPPNLFRPPSVEEIKAMTYALWHGSRRFVKVIPDAPLAVLETLLELLTWGYCVKIRVMPDRESWETEVVRGRVET